MTGGSSPIGYLKAWHTNLYLSADADKVREALAEGEHTHTQKHRCDKVYCLLDRGGGCETQIDQILTQLTCFEPF